MLPSPNSHLNTKLRAAFGFIAVFLFAGCNEVSKPPSESAAKAALEQEIASKSKNQIKLISFKKEDGQSAEPSGVNLYKLRFTAQLEFQSDGTWKSGGVEDMNTGLAFTFLPGYQPRLTDFPTQPKEVRRGDHVKIAGIMQAEKSQNGWRFERGPCEIR